MNKNLNTEYIHFRMNELGLSAPMLAKALGISRESVYNWLKNEKFPHPKHLLQLTRTLNITYKDLFLENDLFEPVIAFRKKANTKTTSNHITRAINMGKALEPLVSYMGLPKFSRPATLIDPKNEYFYIQEVVREFRKTHNLNNDRVQFEDMIGVFSQLHAMLIPVLWGKIKAHENALHIYLPKTMTTWVFLNLDTHIFDFKFWMAHEIGHILAPELRGNEAEDFADMFAGSVLFPIELAKKEYNELTQLYQDAAKINHLKKIARDLVISMYTVLNQINYYAESHNLPKIKLNIGGAVTNFNKEFKSVSEILFDDNKHPNATNYIKIAEGFKSPFFNGLKAYLIEHKRSASIISRILNMPAIDAQAIFEELVRDN